MKISKVLIDGDILLYKLGFSLQSRLVAVSTDGNGLYDVVSKPSTTPDTDYTTTWPSDWADVPDHVDSYIRGVLELLGVSEYLLVFSGTDNFRKLVAKTLPYKGNRDSHVKPIFYHEIFKHLTENYTHVVTCGEEADDLLGKSQTEDTVIASIDKDLRQVPGLHYNLDHKYILRSSDPGELWFKQSEVTGRKSIEGCGFKWFCAQMLLGDRVDNIQGIRGYGDVKVFKTLNDITDPMVLWNTIVAIYDNRPRVEENALLLWIRRSNATTVHDYLKGL